jgi:hypothetical protein
MRWVVILVVALLSLAPLAVGTAGDASALPNTSCCA